MQHKDQDLFDTYMQLLETFKLLHVSRGAEPFGQFNRALYDM